MILVDTSVWVDHFRRGDPDLGKLLESGQVLCHPLIVGEVAMGSLKNRGTVLDALQRLPCILQARDSEVLQLVQGRKLFGLGIGYVDVHLLTSVQLTPGTLLWTRDRRFHGVATELSLASARP